jgi:lipopolysaccharide transport protein LptA
MRASCPDAGFTVRALLVLLALALALPVADAATPRAPARETAPQPIDVVASASRIDSRANRLSFDDVTITQGALTIRADHATADGTGVSFNDSHWEFSGSVRIRFVGGSLQSQAATVRFAGNRMARAQANGGPAEFEQQVEGVGRPVKGRAANIDYDFTAQSVRLAGDAWLFDGRNEMSSPTILYSVRDQVMRNESAPGGRVHITIRPDAAPEARP